MSTNNQETTNKNKNNSGKEIDVREALSFIFSKFWIVALVTICCIIFAFLYTSLFITPVYTSSSKAFIINKNKPAESNLATSDFTLAIQLTKMSEEVFASDEFCELVAKRLNEDFKNESIDVAKKIEEITTELKDEDGTVYTSFTDYFQARFGVSEISAKTIGACISVSSDEEVCSVELHITSPAKELSAIISYVATFSMQEKFNSIFEVEKENQGNETITTAINTIKIVITRSGGVVPTAPSNVHTLRNMIIGGIVGAIIVCVVLLAIFIFDDKIKVPDDVEKHLGISVLGEIPEIEE